MLLNNHSIISIFDDHICVVNPNRTRVSTKLWVICNFVSQSFETRENWMTLQRLSITKSVIDYHSYQQKISEVLQYFYRLDLDTFNYNGVHRIYRCQLEAALFGTIENSNQINSIIAAITHFRKISIRGQFMHSSETLKAIEIIPQLR